MPVSQKMAKLPGSPKHSFSVMQSARAAPSGSDSSIVPAAGAKQSVKSAAQACISPQQNSSPQALTVASWNTSAVHCPPELDETCAGPPVDTEVVTPVTGPAVAPPVPSVPLLPPPPPTPAPSSPHAARAMIVVK